MSSGYGNEKEKSGDGIEGYWMNYIGDMRFRGIDFTFGFDGENLELAPCAERVDEARCLTMRKHGSRWMLPG